MRRRTASRYEIVFGSFRLSPQLGALWKDDQRLRLQEQPLRILELLLDPPGLIVTPERIRESLWPAEAHGDFEHRIHIAVSKLRRALGDATDDPRFVETVPKRGYRFIHPAERRKAADDGWEEGHQATLAVMPYEALSADELATEAAIGLTEELTAQLAELDGERLRLVSRFAAADAGRRLRDDPLQAPSLGIDFVLEGTVRGAAAGGVRAASRLVHAVDQTYVWARSFEHDAEDPVEAQKSLAKAITQSIGERLSIGSGKPAATVSTSPSGRLRELYLKGRHFRDLHTAEGLIRALDYFEKVLAESPDFAEGYASAAQCYCLIGGRGFEVTPPREAMPMARALTERGLRLNPDLPEAHAVFGMVRLKYDWDFEAAEMSFQQALAIRPDFPEAHMWLSILLEATGEPLRALEHAETARRLAPTSPEILVNLAVQCARSGDPDHALEHVQELEEMHPFFWGAPWCAGLVSLVREDWESAVRELERAVELSTQSELVISSLGYAHARDGDGHAAERRLTQLQQASRRRYISPVFSSFICGGLDRLDQAFGHLDSAIEQRSRYLIWLGVSPETTPLRSDRRFMETLNRIGLSKTQRP